MRDWVDRKLESLGGLLLPPRCVLCGSRGQPPCLDLCTACEGLLPTAVPSQVVGPDPLRRSFAPFTYGYPADHLVHALKYRGQLAVGRVLGELLGRHVACAGLASGIDVVVPVPLHPRRHAERGFNQAAEIARHVGRRLQLPVGESKVQRRRATPPQVGLHVEERRRNPADAFGASAVEGLRVAIVDDVTTTGATLRELACVLSQAGAVAVDAWCVARTDRSGRIRSGGRHEPSPSAGRMR